MKILKTLLVLNFSIISFITVIGQVSSVKIKAKKFKATEGIIINGEVGYFNVPENRLNPNSRKIKIKFIRLKSLSKTSKEPLIYLEGGGRACTSQAEDPKALTDWLPLLEVSDLIFIDQRGSNDRKLIFMDKEGSPEDFLVSSETASLHYEAMCKRALTHYKEKGIDVLGYDVVSNAKDVNDLTKVLNIKKYSLFGFSYGSHIGIALINLYEKNIVNAVFTGTDALNQSFNYPSYLDEYFKKVALLAQQDENINTKIPDLNMLLKKVMTKLAEQPVTVTVRHPHPLKTKKMDIKVGPFGLALILRLDIDDVYDIPVLPRLLYDIDRGDYSTLQWFVQKRIVFALAVSGNGLNQNIASGASPERWERIKREAQKSLFGNVVNSPFSEAINVWPKDELEINTSIPTKSAVRTLFITGDLDCRTPENQVNETIRGFKNSTHIVVKNAGHEKAMWNTKIFDEVIPQFLNGQDVSHIKARLKKRAFIPLTGFSDKHPSIRKD